MHKVQSNYSSCTCRSSENICSSSGGAQEKRKMGSKPVLAAYNIFLDPRYLPICYPLVLVIIIIIIILKINCNIL
jgi:hypothetical protein